MGSLLSKNKSRRNSIKQPQKSNGFKRESRQSSVVDIPSVSLAQQPHSNPSSPVRSPGKQTVSEAPKIFKALYDFEQMETDDLSFFRGDKLQIIDDKTSEDWWLAIHMTTNRKGYVPSNYVIDDTEAPEAQDWWFSIDRREAHKQLMLSGNPVGTFLIRNATDQKSYALSIRLRDDNGDFVIKHYRIKKDNGSVYITQKLVFESLSLLVEHYQESLDGLCCLLTTPCPKEVKRVPFKHLEVDRSEIRLGRKLGSGQFGEVFFAKWKGKLDVAVKTLKSDSMTMDAFLNEAKIMHKLHHPKLVQLMGVCTKTPPMYIITEFMCNGALLDYLRDDQKGKLLIFPQLVDMAAQIADGMAYLERQDPPYVHRDLRAANVLVGTNNTVKVADFGLARDLVEGEYTASKESKFPVKWTAPEAAHEQTFSVKSDVWSYGILLYEIVTYGRIPYSGMDAGTVLHSVSNGYRLQRPVGKNYDCPPKMYDTMLKCWEVNPVNRPTFAYLLTFFDDYATESEEHYHASEDN